MRREQLENVEHKRHPQHFTEQLAVLDDGWDKPAEVETSQIASH